MSCPSDGTSSADTELVTIRAVGDIVLGSDWPTSHYPPDFEKTAARRLSETLGHADIVFGNFEGTMTTYDVSTKVPHGGSVFAFRMPPSFAPLLRNAGFNVLHISNNHTYDFGERGFHDTLRYLTEAGIHTVGERDRVTLQRVRGVTVAWVGFNYSLRHNFIGDDEKLVELIRSARHQADLVIVSVHAGAEGNEALRVVDHDETFLGENRRNVFAFARRAVDLGADLVLGVGPHVVRGLECYKGKLIAYSLGNFVGYNALSIRNAAAVSMMLEVSLSHDRRTVAFDVIPLRFSEDRFPLRDSDEQLARFLLNDLSHRPPLNGTVQLPVPDAGTAAYRGWIDAAGLGKFIGD